ncbi:Wzz/FepE/Etk N-terminal domain-containing protein [Parvimonas sp. G1425]
MEQYNNGDYFSVDLVRLIKIIWKNKLKIIIFSLMISLLVGLYTMEFVPYKYKSSTTIYLSNYNEKYQFNNQITSEVKNKDSIKSVIESQKLNISTDELLKNLKVNFDDQNKSITMTYSSTDSGKHLT